MARSKRIVKELDDVRKDTEASITLDLVSEDDLGQLKGTFIGPPDTPYAGGKFIVDIKIPVSTFVLQAVAQINGTNNLVKE